MEQPSFQYYIDQYTTGQLSVQEWRELRILIQDPQHVEALKAIMDRQLETSEKDGYSGVTESSLNQLLSMINAEEPRRVHFIYKWWWAAAAILLIITSTLLFVSTRHTSTSENTSTAIALNDVLPGSNKAVLTLSDGKTITLDSAAIGSIAQQGSSSVIKQADGRVVYDAGGHAVEAVMNIMTTPKGGQYQLTLSDGTKVWLNAASSIRYPTVFTGKSRTVHVTGEAYFEVTKNREKPFIVQTPADTITVLGTSFNINTYEDETSMKASLVDGSIKVDEQILKPGQAFQNGKIINTNTQQDVAWKNGIFNFNGMDWRAVFRQLSRWYNVDVHYEGAIPGKPIGGEMGRNLNLSQVLIVLKELGIHTRLEGNTLIVSSN